MESLTKKQDNAAKLSQYELELLKANIGEKVILDRLSYKDEVVLEDIVGFQCGEEYFLTHFIANNRGRTQKYPIYETKPLFVRRSRDERLLWNSLHPMSNDQTSNYKNKYTGKIDDIPLAHA